MHFYLGDPSGIGPELSFKLLKEEITNKANIVVIGEKNILKVEIKFLVTHIILKSVENFDEINFNRIKQYFLDISKGKNHNYKISERSKESGESVLISIKFST